MRDTIRNSLRQRVRRGAKRDGACFFERVYVVESALRDMAAESEAKPGRETGGVLVGFIDPQLRALVVTHASGPGPKALHRANRFERDREFCQAFLDQHASVSGGVLDFVGEWHKHREPDPWPSTVDQDTYRSLAANPDCHLDEVLALITGTKNPGRRAPDRYVRTNGFLFRPEGFVSRTVQSLPEEAYEDLLQFLRDRSSDRSDSVPFPTD